MHTIEIAEDLSIHISEKGLCLLFSYSKALVSPDRLSQVNNSELLKVYPDTGLQYRDAIAQLKNITAQLTSCSGTLDCDVQLVSLSVPTPSDFTLTGPRYVNISR